MITDVNMAVELAPAADVAALKTWLEDTFFSGSSYISYKRSFGILFVNAGIDNPLVDGNGDLVGLFPGPNGLPDFTEVEGRSEVTSIINCTTKVL